MCVPLIKAKNQPTKESEKKRHERRTSKMKQQVTSPTSTDNNDQAYIEKFQKVLSRHKELEKLLEQKRQERDKLQLEIETIEKELAVYGQLLAQVNKLKGNLSASSARDTPSIGNSSNASSSSSSSSSNSNNNNRAGRKRSAQNGTNAKASKQKKGSTNKKQKTQTGRVETSKNAQVSKVTEKNGVENDSTLTHDTSERMTRSRVSLLQGQLSEYSENNNRKKSSYVEEESEVEPDDEIAGDDDYNLNSENSNSSYEDSD